MIGPASHSFFSQRLRLRYVDWGNKDAPPLLLVHGGRDHCRNWDWVAQDLCKDYHVIAHDLRGHGDSQWVNGTSYPVTDHIYDFAQLIEQKEFAPVRIIAHSFGGAISLLYTGLYPKNVSKILVVEGAGQGPPEVRNLVAKPVDERMLYWIEDLRGKSGRIGRRYDNLEAALQRMQKENPHLTEDQARHLTIHGANQNEDGTYSWKFDGYTGTVVRPNGLTVDEQYELWQRIECPVLLVQGKESWAYDPKESAAPRFRNARYTTIENAGHWVHHDQLQEFLKVARAFLEE